MNFFCQKCEKGIKIDNDIMSNRGEASEPTPFADRQQKLQELFINLSNTSSSDHPLCTDCSTAHINDQSTQYYDIITDTRQYSEVLVQLQEGIEKLEFVTDEEIENVSNA